MFEIVCTPNARFVSQKMDQVKGLTFDAIVRLGLRELLKCEEAILERTRFALAHEFGHLYFNTGFDQSQRYLGSSLLVAREIIGPPHGDLKPEYELTDLESGRYLSSPWLKWPLEILPALPVDRWRLELKCDDPLLGLRFQYPEG